MPTNPTNHNPITRAKYTARRTKRVDLEERHLALLERLCNVTNMSEAEVWRRALEALAEKLGFESEEEFTNGKPEPTEPTEPKSYCELSDEEVLETINRKGFRSWSDDQMYGCFTQPQLNYNPEQLKRLMEQR